MQLRKAAERFCTRTDWLSSWHSFSYGQWYDPDNVGFGPLVVSNHDVLAAGAGFDEHLHAGVDLVTYVVSGALEHRDSLGNVGVVRAGEVQLLRSGSGVRHSERNASAHDPVEYVQMWLRSADTAVSYTAAALPLHLPHGDLHPVSSDVDLEPGLLHAYVVSGSARAGDMTLQAGDAVRLEHEPVRLGVTDPATRVLVWHLR